MSKEAAVEQVLRQQIASIRAASGLPPWPGNEADKRDLSRAVATALQEKSAGELERQLRTIAGEAKTGGLFHKVLADGGWI